MNPENGKLMFKQEYLYLAILSKSEMPVKIRITTKFKLEQVKKALIRR